MQYTIKRWYDSKVLFEIEAESLTAKEVLLKAVASGANLSYANLSNANLSNANLSNANLSNADLSNANLSNANLSNANLRSANLRSANLSNADLSNANLSNADLSNANLSAIKADFFMVLLYAKHEVGYLRQALKDGKIDGSTYSGDCCCLVGTVANGRKCYYYEYPGLNPDASRPAERWFTGIKPSDTPDNSSICKITLEWIDEFIELINSYIE